MEQINPEHQEFYEKNTQAYMALKGFRTIQRQHGGNLQFRDVIDLTVEDVETSPELIIDLTEAIQDSQLSDNDLLVLEAQRQNALMAVDAREQGSIGQTVSLTRLSEIDDVHSFMADADEQGAELELVGDAKKLREPSSRTALFKGAGSVAIVESVEKPNDSEARYTRVEFHNVGEN